MEPKERKEVVSALHIALLRGVNVSGRRMIPMAALRAVTAGLGFEKVATHIQTGNLLFESARDPQDVRLALEAAIMSAFGHAVKVAVRSPQEIAEVVGGCPFEPAEGEVVYVAFATTPWEPGRGAEVSGRATVGGDSFALGDHHVYIHYRSGVHGSPLSNAYFERAVGVALTSRNLSTLGRLRDLAARRVDTA
jgi:uncharacterized protein (DUF1697 family)